MCDGKKNRSIAIFIAVVLGLAVLLVLVLPAVSAGTETGVPVVSPDASGSPSPEASPSYSPTASPSPEPVPSASAATVRRAHERRKAAHRAWLKYRSAARCFHKHVVPFLTITPRYPARSAPEGVWRDYGKRWRNKRIQYLERYQTLRQRMLHPGGSGAARWMPLARWVGWPESALGTLTFIINRESGGNPNAKNPYSTASGLLQFLSSWWAGKWNPFDPTQALSHGYRAWCQVGWAPWGY